MLLPSQYKNVAIKRSQWQDYDDDDKDSGDVHIRIVAMDYISYGTSTTGTVQCNRGGTYF